MAHLIDKDALVAEIERRRDAASMRQQNLESIGQESVINEMVANELNRIISFIDTLEVKEVEISILNIDDLFEENGIDPTSKVAKNFKESYYTALENLKVQKGEEV